MNTYEDWGKDFPRGILPSEKKDIKPIASKSKIQAKHFLNPDKNLFLIVFMLLRNQTTSRTLAKSSSIIKRFYQGTINIGVL